MGIYYVKGLSAATAATADNAIAEIWNPSATRTITLWELAVVCSVAPAAGGGFHMARSTAKGTSTLTVTPTIEHERGREAAPASAFTLELTFSAEPTKAAGRLHPVWIFAAVIAAGIYMPIPRGIQIPPGQGLCLLNRAAIAFPASEIGIVVED